MRTNKNAKPTDDLGRTVDLEALTATYAVSIDTFDVTLPTGEVLVFEPIKRMAHQKAIYAAAAAMYESLPKLGTKAAEIHMWNGWLPENQDEFYHAFLISELSVATYANEATRKKAGDAPDKTTKIGHLHALKMLRAPHLIEFLVTCIEQNSKTLSSIRFAQRVADAKKNLIQTLLKPGESDAPPKPSTSTRRSSPRKKKNSSPS